MFELLCHATIAAIAANLPIEVPLVPGATASPNDCKDNSCAAKGPLQRARASRGKRALRQYGFRDRVAEGCARDKHPTATRNASERAGA